MMTIMTSHLARSHPYEVCIIVNAHTRALMHTRTGVYQSLRNVFVAILCSFEQW